MKLTQPTSIEHAVELYAQNTIHGFDDDHNKKLTESLSIIETVRQFLTENTEGK